MFFIKPLRFNSRCISDFYKVQIFYLQERNYGSRRGTRERKEREKRARKLTEPEKPKKILSYMIRKTVRKPELEAKRITDDNWQESKPIDDVWRTALYRGKPYSFNEIIEMYRETHSPSMLNRPNAFIYATIEFDLRMKKKDYYLENFTGILSYPHYFESGVLNKIIAICRNEDDQLKASEAGAVYTGSSALIKKIIAGEIISEDYDYVVCHPDTYKELGSLRGLLKKNYPTAHNGLLRLDVDQAVTQFMKGMKFESKRSVIELDFGWTDVAFGRLDMNISALEENFKYLLNALLKYRPVGVDFPFITRTMLWCQHSYEKLIVPHEKYLPGYKESNDEAELETKVENVNVSAS